MEQAARKSVHQFAGTVFRRSAVEQIGGFHPQFIHAADWDMWRRLAVHGPVVYDPTVLACYRMFAGNDSSRLIRTGANMADLHKSINFSARYLPADRSGPWLDYARSFYGWCALDMAAKLFHQGDRDAYKAQLREAIKLNPPLAVLPGRRQAPRPGGPRPPRPPLTAGPTSRRPRRGSRSATSRPVAVPHRGVSHIGTKTLTAILGFTEPTGSYGDSSPQSQGDARPSRFGGDIQ